MRKLFKSLVLILLTVILFTSMIQATGPELIGISNLTTGEQKSGIFQIEGVVLDASSAVKVAVKVGEGPWEAANGVDTWSYTVNSRQIVLGYEYHFDSARGSLVKEYQRGPYYGDLSITVGAFNATGYPVAQKPVTVKIIPQAPVSDLSSGTYGGPLNVFLNAAPEVKIYYTINGADPKVSGIQYYGAIYVSADTVIKAVAKSDNNYYSDPLTLDLKIDNGTPLAYSIQYYYDEALTLALPDPPYLKAGTYYLKITTNRNLSAGPYLTINAPGNINDVTQVGVITLGNSVFRYPRVINNDIAATGQIQEVIQITATDTDGNQLQNTFPVNAATKTAYVDTQPPTLGSISPEGGIYTTSDPTPYFVINSTGAARMRLSLSEPGLATAPWVNYATRYDRFDISSGGDGIKTIWIEFQDQAGNIQTAHAFTTLSFSNYLLSFDIEYYSDSGLTHSLGPNPHLSIGTYYLKITANQDLATNPMVDINAEGTNNNVFIETTTRITNRIFCYTRSLVADPAAIGDSRESILVMGITPSNADLYAAYTITAQYTLAITNDGYGSTSPSGNVTVNYGASININATPNSGYHFINWTQTTGAGDVVFDNPNSANTTLTLTGGNATIRANFSVDNSIQNLLTVSNDGNGTTAPSGVVVVSNGASTVITATPNAGSRFIGWAKTAGSGTVVFGDANSVSTTVTVIGGDATIRADFIPQLSLGTWTAGSITTGGSKWYYFPATSGAQYPIKWDDCYSGSGAYTCDVKVSAYQADLTTPYFSGVDSGYYSPQYITAQQEYVYILVQGHSSYSSGSFMVRVNPPLYTLTITTDWNGTTTPSSPVSVTTGAITSITATPKAGYQFVNWTKTSGTGTVVFGDANSANTNVTVTDGNSTIRANFVPIPLQNILAIAGGSDHSLALKDDGTVWAWGKNNNGELGNGTYTNSNVPLPVSDLNDVNAIAAGVFHSLALKNDGTIRAWGLNNLGQLGNETYTNSNIPVQVSGLNNIIAIAGGCYHSLALKDDGTVKAWGYNSEGQLGNGTYTNSNIPVQVSNLTGIIAIAGGYYHNLALKDDGTVWAWGRNSYGQLGNSSSFSSNIPVQVSGLCGIIAIASGGSHSLALKNDGTVWAWGGNNYGQLGNGSNVNNYIPVQVSGLSGIIAIASGGSHSLALKNDGTVWAWGYNYYGQLGTGTITDSNIPVQVNGLDGSIALAGGIYYSLALKNDGTVRAFGYNGSGQLGNNSYTSSNVPVQAGGPGPALSPYLSLLTVTSDGYGSVTPSGNMIGIDSVHTALTATPNAGYQFVNWSQTSGTGTAVFENAASASTTVTLTGGYGAIRANFSVDNSIQYTLTITDDGNGTTAPTGAVTVNNGASTTINATLNPGSWFIGWMKTAGSGTVVFGNANSASTTVTVIGGDATIRAEFIQQLALSTWTTGSITAGGSKWYYFPATIGAKYPIYWDARYSGSGTYTCDVKVSAYQADLTTAYFTRVDYGYNSPRYITAQQEYVYILVQGFSSYSAGSFAVKFNPPQYTLTVTNDGNGTTTPSGPIMENDGAITNITATPNTGYQFVNWTKTTGTGTVVFGDATSASTTVIVTGGDATIRANFNIDTTIQYTLTVTNDGNGTTTPSGAVTVNNSISSNITATPNVGYQFYNWMKIAGTGSVVFGNATSASTAVTVTGGAATIRAIFIQSLPIDTWTTGSITAGGYKWYVLQTTVGANYCINWDDSRSGSGAYTCDVIVSAYQKDLTTPYFYGADSGWFTPKLITAQQDCIYFLVEGYDSSSAGSFAIRRGPPQNSLTVTNDGNGTAAPSGGIWVVNGVNLNIRATPSTGCQFINWTKTAGSGTVIFDNDNAASTTVTLTGGDATIRANFIVDNTTEYSLTVTNDGNGTTTPSDTVTVFNGISLNITATPNAGNQFINWVKTSGTGIVLFGNPNSASTTVTVTGGDATIRANFAQPLPFDTWTTGSITAGGSKWYYFPATSETPYSIQWDDCYQGSRTYTGNVKVSAYRKDLTTPYFSGVDSGYSSPRLITAQQDRIYLLVQEYSSGSAGSFAVRVNLPQYTLTVTNDGSGTTTPSAAITVIHGASTAITAVPLPDCQFLNWTKTAGTGTVIFDNANAASTTVTLTGGNATIQANFSVDTTIRYTLDVTNNGNGTTTLLGAVSVNNGVSSNITATPDAGYQFINWTKTAGTGTVVFGNPNSASTTVTVTGGDATIQANFALPLPFDTWTTGSITAGDSIWYYFPTTNGIQYAIQWDDSKQGSGTYTCDVKVSAYLNDLTTPYFPGMWDNGYITPRLICAQQDGIYLLVQGYSSYDAGNFAIKAGPPPNTLTVTNDGNGTTAPSGAVSVINGASTNISATSNAGCQFLNWTKTAGSGTVIFGNANAASTTVTLTGGNATIRANFSVDATIEYNLTVTNDGNGTTTPPGPTMVHNGVSSSITATPNSGYLFTNWTKTAGTGTVVFGNSNSMNTTATVTSGPATIQANFALQIPFNTWTTGSISAEGSKWYYFPATSGTQYSIQWDDSYEGSGTYTGIVKVSAYRNDLTTPYFSEWDCGYSSPLLITAQQNGIYILVQGVTNGWTGSFAVRVNTL